MVLIKPSCSVRPRIGLIRSPSGANVRSGTARIWCIAPVAGLDDRLARVRKPILYRTLHSAGGCFPVTAVLLGWGPLIPPVPA